MGKVALSTEHPDTVFPRWISLASVRPWRPCVRPPLVAVRQGLLAPVAVPTADRCALLCPTAAGDQEPPRPRAHENRATLRR